MALRPLSRTSDFAFPEDAWDVRGWNVRTDVDDEKVGSVDDMLLDHTGRLRYLDVDLGFLKKHVLVPLDRARADRQTETVRVEGMSKERLEAIPEYALDPETLDEAYERRLDAVYGRTRTSGGYGTITTGVDPEAPIDLQRMGKLEGNYRVAGDDPRGWKVVTGEGQKVGKVAELLMERGSMKARFLDVAVDEKSLEMEPVDRHVLLPAERVRLDRGKKQVVVSGLLAGDLADYPQYGGLPVTEGAARSLDDAFERVGTDPTDARRDAPRPRAAWDDDALHHFYDQDRQGGMNVEERHG